MTTPDMDGLRTTGIINDDPDIWDLTDICDMVEESSLFDLAGSDWLRVAKDIINKRSSVIKEQRQIWKKMLDLPKQAIQHKLSESTAIKFRDKISFVFGVSNVWITSFLLGFAPLLLPTTFSIKAVLLIGTRFFMYRPKRWHYFLFDMCYFVNLLMLFFLWVFPTNQMLFLAIFGLSHGPLVWAILAWNNSLVFHSLDKVTSIFIHFDPPLTLYAMRWHGCHPRYTAITSIGLNQYPTFFSVITVSLLTYVFWQLLYYIFVTILRSDKIRKGHVVSHTWLLADSKSRMFKVCNYFGPDYQVYMYMVVQLVFTLVTVLPTFMLLRSQIIHAGLLTFILSVSIYNGANYYIEVFSKRYIQELQVLGKQLDKMTADIPSPVVSDGESSDIVHRKLKK